MNSRVEARIRRIEQAAGVKRGLASWSDSELDDRISEIMELLRMTGGLPAMRATTEKLRPSLLPIFDQYAGLLP